MNSYPMELRQRVIDAYDAGASAAKVAERFCVSGRWVQQLLRRRRETGSIAALPPSGGTGKIKLDASICTKLVEWLREDNDLTLAQLRDRLNDIGIAVTKPAIWYKLDALQLTFKKNLARRRARASGREKTT